MLSIKTILIAKGLSIALLLIPLYAIADTQLFSTETIEKSVSKCGTLSDFNACNYIAGGWVMTHVSPQLNDTNWKISDNKSQGFKLIAGRHFKPHWFGEFSYTDLGATEIADRLNSSIEQKGFYTRQHHYKWVIYYESIMNSLTCI